MDKKDGKIVHSPYVPVYETPMDLESTKKYKAEALKRLKKEFFMKKYFKYLSYVLRHKWYVMLECFKCGLIWRGLVHDLCKFKPSSFIPYMNHFAAGIQSGRDKTGYYKPYDSGDPAFDLAVHRHTNGNDHHWQYWVQPKDGRGVKLHIMTEIAIKEMICDWHGASRAQKSTGSVKEWYIKNGLKMQLHSETRKQIDVKMSCGIHSSLF